MPPLKQNKSLANVPAKRKPDIETQSPPQKRARLEDVAVTMTKQDLDSLDHEALVARVLALQEHVASLNKSTNLAPVFAPSPPKMTPEQLASKVDTARHMMIVGLENQMKWKPSCKTNGAKFSYSAFVPDPAVFFTLFNLPLDWKKKQIKLTPDEFCDTVAKQTISASVRYANLYLVSKNVTVYWNTEAQTFYVSGSYGLPH